MNIKQIFILSFLIAMNMQFAIGQNQSKAYDFPIKPGTKEWARLDTYEKRLDAYNVPEKLLQNMNTADLVQTCLNYPEFRLIMTRNSLQQGYDYLKSVFNGFSELEKRKDAGTELLKVYEKLNPAEITKYDTPVKRGGFAFEFTYIEIILAQKAVLINLSKKEKVGLIKKSVSDYEIKERMTDNYSPFGLTTPALILGRLLDIDKFQEFYTKKAKDSKMQSFVDYTHLGSRSTLSDIIKISKLYLKQIENE
ncbi:hypothetical protein LR002_03010 [Candidatus Gracilibacteria bacterium]|nr:hypothetical protein [Candidatus Gracilibacteria bacterium]